MTVDVKDPLYIKCEIYINFLKGRNFPAISLCKLLGKRVNFAPCLSVAPCRRQAYI